MNMYELAADQTEYVIQNTKSGSAALYCESSCASIFWTFYWLKNNKGKKQINQNENTG